MTPSVVLPKTQTTERSGKGTQERVNTMISLSQMTSGLEQVALEGCTADPPNLQSRPLTHLPRGRQTSISTVHLQ